jgi:hypothetical protein
MAFNFNSNRLAELEKELNDFKEDEEAQEADSRDHTRFFGDSTQCL